MKAKNFHGIILSIHFYNFTNHLNLEFDLTSMQDGTENCPYPGVIAKSLSLEQNFTTSLEHSFKLIVMGIRMSDITVDKISVAGKSISNGERCPPTIIQLYPPTQIQVLWFLALSFCPNFSLWDFVFIKT